MRLFDAHCHLQDARLAADIAAVLQRAERAEIAGLSCCGTEEADWDDVARLSRSHEAIHPSYGIHPWYLKDRAAGWRENLLRRLQADPGAGVGEIGLDHAIEPREDSDQTAAFKQQMEMARELRRPASIHCRRAWATLLDVLRNFGEFPAGFVVHSYSGSPELVEALSPLGARFSFSGSITYAGNRRARKSLAVVPLDRLLIETDAPDIPPYPIRGQSSAGDPTPVNEPANLVYVLRTVSELTNEPQPRLAAILWENSIHIFGERDGKAG